MKRLPVVAGLCAILGAGLFATSAWCEEAKPRPEPYYGKNGQWHACQKERLIRLEDDKSLYDEKELAKLIKRAEERGDDETIYLLAKTNKKSADGKVDLEFVSKWQKRALEINHPAALFEAGEIAYRQGKISRDEFIKLAETAAQDHGGYDIPYRLALGYADPDSAPEGFDTLPANPEKALYWMKVAAERANAAAADDLCNAYFEGDSRFGTPVSFNEAKKWCFMAAQAMCTIRAPKHLSEMYWRGKGLPRDLKEATYWKKFAEERIKYAPNPPPRPNIQTYPMPLQIPLCSAEYGSRFSAYMATFSENEIQSLVEQAEAGDIEVMALLSAIQKTGTNGKHDYEFSYYWRRKGAAAGHPVLRYADRIKAYYDAVYNNKPDGFNQSAYLKSAEDAALLGQNAGVAYALGDAYTNPERASNFNFLTVDPKKAIYWLRISAEMGHQAAAEQLCGAYFHGNFVSKDYGEAKRWCVVASLESCSSNSRANLFMMYKDGLGLPRNEVDSRYWERYVTDEFPSRKKKMERLSNF